VAAAIACFQTLRVPETRGRLASRRAGAADAE
jgi:hypothetical protein